MWWWRRDTDLDVVVDEWHISGCGDGGVTVLDSTKLISITFN